jgi:hypothetical protein
MSAAKAIAAPNKPNKQLPDPKRKSVQETPIHFLPPLRPRRGLFIGLLITFVVWIVFLLVLYFRTVHGHVSA